MNRDDFVHEMRRELVRSRSPPRSAPGLKCPQPHGGRALPAAERGAHDLLRRRRRDIDRAGGRAEPERPCRPTSTRTRSSSARRNTASSRSSTLDPAKIADPNAITEEEIAAEYEKRKPSLTQPERRRIEQIRFATAEAAERGDEKIEGGEDFLRSPTARGVRGDRPRRQDEGRGARPGGGRCRLHRRAQQAGRSSPRRRLEPSIIRVTSIEAEKVTPLAEVGAAHSPGSRDARRARERARPLRPGRGRARRRRYAGGGGDEAPAALSRRRGGVRRSARRPTAARDRRHPAKRRRS